MSADTQRIQHLNDRLRQDLLQGSVGHNIVSISSGVASLGDSFVIAATQAVAEFNTFTEGNDPWKEHDFGAVSVGGEDLFWKINYYDLNLEYLSENPAVASKTKRVLTIMLTDEY